MLRFVLKAIVEFVWHDVGGTVKNLALRYWGVWFKNIDWIYGFFRHLKSKTLVEYFNAHSFKNIYQYSKHDF